MRRALLLSALVFSACNAARDDADRALQAELDLALAEAQDTADNIVERRREHDLITAHLAAFALRSDDELLALAGDGARLTSERSEGRSQRIDVRGPGPLHDVARFVRRLPEAYGPTSLEVDAEGWKLSLTVVSPRPTPAWTSAVRAPVADETFCFSSCRARRACLADTNERLARIEQVTLGPLATLSRDRRELEAHLTLRAKYPPAQRLVEWLEGLERATWAPRLVANFGPTEVVIPSRDDHSSECRATFPTCQFDRQRGLLIIDLAAP